MTISTNLTKTSRRPKKTCPRKKRQHFHFKKFRIMCVGEVSYKIQERSPQVLLSHEVKARHKIREHPGG